MMETLPTHLRAHGTEWKEPNRNQNKEEEPPGHDPGEVESNLKLWNAGSQTSAWNQNATPTSA
jgi:hypothetical protein